MKALIEKIKTWLDNNHVKKVGNLAIMVALLVFGKVFIAGIFFGFFLNNNKELFNSLIDKAKSLFKKKEA